MDNLTLKVIARIYTDFGEKFGVPRQSGLVPELTGKIIFEPEYRVPEALSGIEGYSWLWLLWGFSESPRNKWSPTVRPPRLVRTSLQQKLLNLNIPEIFDIFLIRIL